MYTIELFKEAGTWHAKHTNPSVIELFGTDTLPTAYGAGMSAHHVINLIQIKNPDCEVRLHKCMQQVFEAKL